VVEFVEPGLWVIVAVARPAVNAVSKIISLLIVLHGTKPSERAVLVKALAELFRGRPWPSIGGTRRQRRSLDVSKE